MDIVRRRVVRTISSTIQLDHCYTYGPPTCALVLMLVLGLKSVLWFASVALAGVLGKDCLALCRHAVAYRRSTLNTVTPAGNTVEVMVNDSPTLVDLTVSASRMPAEVAPLLTVTGGKLQRSILAPLTRRTLSHRGGEAFEVERTLTSVDSDAGLVSSMLKVKPFQVKLVTGSAAAPVVKYVNHLAEEENKNGDEPTGRAALVRLAGEGIARTVATGRTVAAAARSPKSAIAGACRWASSLPLTAVAQAVPLLRRLLRAAKAQEDAAAVVEVGLELMQGSMLCCTVDEGGLCRSSLRAAEPALARSAMPAAVLHHRETAMPCFAVQDEHGDVILLGEEAALPSSSSTGTATLLATPAGLRVAACSSAKRLREVYDVPEEAMDIVATARGMGRGEVKPGPEALFM